MTSDITTVVEELAKKVEALSRTTRMGVSCKILSEGQDNCQCAKCYTDRSVGQVWDRLEEIDNQLQQSSNACTPIADPQVGVCSICNCAIWQHQAQSGNDHQVCQLIRRAEMAEKALEEEMNRLRNGEEVYIAGRGICVLGPPNKILEEQVQDIKKLNEDLIEEVQEHANNALALSEQLTEQQEKYEKLASEFGEMALHYREVERKAKILDQLVRQQKVDVKSNGTLWVLVKWQGSYSTVVEKLKAAAELLHERSEQYVGVCTEADEAKRRAEANQAAADRIPNLIHEYEIERQYRLKAEAERDELTRRVQYAISDYKKEA